MEKVEREELELLKDSINCYLERSFGHKNDDLFEEDTIEQVAHTENEIGEELNVYVNIDEIEVIKETYYKNYYKEIERFDTLKEMAKWFYTVDFEELVSLNIEA